MSAEPGSGASYAEAGVSLAAADQVVERIKGALDGTAGPRVLEGVGGFGGLFALPEVNGGNAVLVASTDGVGTKLLVAQRTGRYGTVGIDLVAMCADDVVCCGARPLFLLDYLVTGRVDPDRIEPVITGIATGCRLAGCALLGGETAEHPDAMAPDDLDLAGFVVGLADRRALLGAHLVTDGDLLVGLASPGLRSNGYSLARHVLLERAQRPLGAPAWPGAEHSLADELLRPSRIYTPAVLAAIEAHPGMVHAAAHITGGGIPGNLGRVLPADRDAEVVGDSWKVPRIFSEIQHLGHVAEDEMARVFNLGIGMILVVDPRGAEPVQATLRDAGEEVVVMGKVVPGEGAVRWS